MGQAIADMPVYINEMEQAICGEWHLDKWPLCDHSDHDKGRAILDAIKPSAGLCCFPVMAYMQPTWDCTLGAGHNGPHLRVEDYA